MKKPEPGVAKDKERGTWFYVIDAPGKNGNRHQEKKRGFATMDDANQAVIKRRAQIKAGHVPIPDDDSVEAFARAWIVALPAEGLEAATVKHYAESTARSMPTIGALKLQDLTALDLDGAYGKLLEAGRGADSTSEPCRREEDARRSVTAREGRQERRNRRTTAKSESRARKTFQTWAYPQLGRFLDRVAETEHAALWHVAGLTGMRQGELVALQWSDVDLDDAHHISVCRSVGRGADGCYAKQPKSDAGRRTVELDASLIDVLRHHRQAQLERRLAIGAGWRDHDLVFCEVDGSPIDPRRLGKRWSTLVRRHATALDIPVIRFHDLRHSHATQLLAADVRPDVVTERLGHASVAFTLQQYGHRYAGDQRSGLARLRKVL